MSACQHRSGWRVHRIKNSLGPLTQPDPKVSLISRSSTPYLMSFVDPGRRSVSRPGSLVADRGDRLGWRQRPTVASKRYRQKRRPRSRCPVLISLARGDSLHKSVARNRYATAVCTLFGRGSFWRVLPCKPTMQQAQQRCGRVSLVGPRLRRCSPPCVGYFCFARSRSTKRRGLLFSLERMGTHEGNANPPDRATSPSKMSG